MAFPFPVSGIVFDKDGSTRLSNVRVSVLNLRTNEELTQLTSNGEYLLDISNLTSGYSQGDDISVYASFGRNYNEAVFTVSGNSKEQNLTLNIPFPTAAAYATVTEVRNYTKVGSVEWSDSAVWQLIRAKTNLIDELTGRTWRGYQTVSNELYDGNDTDTLHLNQTDLQSLTAISIDDDNDGTFTTVSTSSVFAYNEGYLMLDSKATITIFRAGPKNVKISYTYGNIRPTEAVRELCVLMCAQVMNMIASRQTQIDLLLSKLSWKGSRSLS